MFVDSWQRPLFYPDFHRLLVKPESTNSLILNVAPNLLMQFRIPCKILHNSNTTQYSCNFNGSWNISQGKKYPLDFNFFRMYILKKSNKMKFRQLLQILEVWSISFPFLHQNRTGLILSENVTFIYLLYSILSIYLQQFLRDFTESG